MTLDDLIALNAEIAALVRAGVPLETGLAQLGADLPGRLGRFAVVLAERTARGESLAEAMAQEGTSLPPAYRAVVEAGSRAGRLPAALEAVAASARRLSETYHAATVTVIYPALVVLVAWCGLLLFTCAIAPRLETSFRGLDVPGHQFFGVLARAGHVAWYWGPVVPLFLLLLVFLGWLGSRRAVWMQRFCTRTPWIRRMLRNSRTATFFELLALLVENDTPLPEAVTLAAEASGDPQLLQSARRLATAIHSGEALPAHDPSLPPLVNWLLATTGRSGALLSSLRHAATFYHHRTRRQADLLRLMLPVILTIVVGGGITTTYALMLFLPYTLMLRSLAG